MSTSCSALLLAAASLTALPLHATATQLDDGYRQMYNLQFADAHRSFQEYQQQHPDDPMGPVSDAAAYLFSEFDRLRILQSELFVDNTSLFEFRRPNADPVVKEKFQAAIQKGLELAQSALARSPGDTNAQFATVLRMGLYSDYLAPKVLETARDALGLDDRDVAVSWDCLRKTGNLSSASVLAVLEEVMLNRRPEARTLSVLAAMGPGFCSELLLLRW